MDAMEMLNSVRSTLWARAEGRNEGGDIEVMKAVDAIVKRESRVVVDAEDINMEEVLGLE
jgi:hypothetical protein